MCFIYINTDQISEITIMNSLMQYYYNCHLHELAVDNQTMNYLYVDFIMYNNLQSNVQYEYV